MVKLRDKKLSLFLYLFIFKFMRLHTIKDKYEIGKIKTYEDVPGWIGCAEDIYKIIIDKLEDGDSIVEIGTFFGQSTIFMASLIKQSGKRIKFDTIDSLWQIDADVRRGDHPKSFYEYRFSKELTNIPIDELIKAHYRLCGVEEYINLMIGDSRWLWKWYDEESLKFVYIDGDHNYDIVKLDMNNWWSRVKVGGYMGGDDIDAYPSVLKAMNELIEEKSIDRERVQIFPNSFLIQK
jgi:hypothetical protein